MLAGCLGIAVASANVSAQSSERPADVQLRNDCRLAAQVLRTGHPAPKAEWAMKMIANCAVDGPPVLAQLWSAPALDSARAEQLLDASTRLRDDRLADAALRVLQTTTHPEAARLAGLILLVRYADPYAGLAVPLLVPPAGWVPGRPVRSIPVGLSPHENPQLRGEVPLPPDFVDETLAVLRQLGISEPNPRVRWAAAGLVRTLEIAKAGGHLTHQH